MKSVGASGILLVVGGRTMLSAGVHAICSATFGGFLGHAVLRGRLASRIAWSLTGLVIAIALHGAWNAALASFGPVGENGEPRLWLAG